MEQVLFNGIVLGAVYALIALGLTMVFSIMRVVNFAHGQMYMLGAFVVYYAYAVYGLPFWLALPLAGLVLAGVGIAFNRFFFQPVLVNAKREENSMLMAVGTALLLENLALTVFGEKQRGVPPVIEGVWVLGDGVAFVPYANILVASLAIAFIVFVAKARRKKALAAATGYRPRSSPAR